MTMRDDILKVFTSGEEMKKKKDEELELKKPGPDEDRVQTCERAICGMLDRLDSLEKSMDHAWGEIAKGVHLCNSDTRLYTVEERLTQLEQNSLDNFHDIRAVKHKEPEPIFEELEKRGLVRKSSQTGDLLLTGKGRQLKKLFDDTYIVDIRE
jgi:hypothetical protein